MVKFRFLNYSFLCILFGCSFLLNSTFATTAVLSDANKCIISLVQNNWTKLAPNYQHQLSRTLAGLVGIGWDDLLNKATAPVLAETFQKCQVTPDGVYLVPDGVTVLPIQRSIIDSMSRLYMNFTEYDSRVTKERSVSGHIGFLLGKISGSYSDRHEEVKRSIYQLKTVMLHTTLVYHGYTLIVDGTNSLAPGFRGRIEEIGTALSKNLTKKAALLAELLIRDFGTHVVNRAEVGALIEKEDFVSNREEMRTEEELNSMRASAAASFLSAFKASVNFKKNASASEMQNFTSELKDSRFRTIGGPSVHRLIDWNGPENNHLYMDDVVAFDVKGLALANLINPANFHAYSFPLLTAIHAVVQIASNAYYEHNTVRGCTQPDAENFNFQANVDDGSCKKNKHHYTLGGLYQECRPIDGPYWRCDDIKQVNLYTGGMTCSKEFQSVKIFSLVHHFPPRHVTEEWKHCESFFIFWEDCDYGYFDTVYQDSVQIDFYECRAKTLDQTNGAMFGGLYSLTTVNPFTQQNGCPIHFVPFRMGVDHFVCIGRDYELGQAASIPFARFFSCQTIGEVNKTCPDGFSQHLAGIFEHCEVYYCVRTGAFNHYMSRPIHRPPYTDMRYLLTDSPVSMIYGTFRQVPFLKIPVKEALNRVDSHIKPALLTSSSNNIIDTKIDAFFNHTKHEIMHLANTNPLIWTTWKQLIQNGKSQNEIMEYLGKAYKEEQQQQNGDKNSNGIIWRMMTVIACIVMVIGLLLLILLGLKTMKRKMEKNEEDGYQQIND